MHNRVLAATLTATILVGAATCLAQSRSQPESQAEMSGLVSQVEAVERSFAQTMADRDLEAFTAHLSEEAIFLGGPSALRGKAAVVEGWKAFFNGPQAPFSWRPETVEILESGNLALSTGPVYTPDGTLVSTFTSIWRKEGGDWRIVFDKGNPVCPEPAGSP